VIVSEPDGERRARTTLSIYMGGLGFLILVVVWAARFVLFQPWTARDWVSGAATGRTLYLVGGRNKGGGGLVESYRVDVPTRRIRRTADLPSGRFASAVAASPAGIAILGGYDGKEVFDDVLLLDSKGRVRATGRLPSPRAFAAAAAVGAEVYCVGGWTGERVVDDITAVDPATGGSRLVGRLPSAREQAAAAEASGRLYVVGGSDASGTYLDEVLELSTADGSVLRLAHLPSARTRSALAAVATGVVVIGGWTGDDSAEAFRIDNTGTDLQIVPLPALPKGLSSVTAGPFGAEVVIAGGTNERFPRQIGLWAWSPESGTARSIKLRSFLFW
jgi:hypothetical protein